MLDLPDVFVGLTVFAFGLPQGFFIDIEWSCYVKSVKPKIIIRHRPWSKPMCGRV
ncbi:hypothetical protein [Moraxella lacunata]|uniref:hypothetical protein n=1 Tax=Moraxella lacunata TaxID=477 RepID=UPI003EE1E644